VGFANDLRRRRFEPGRATGAARRGAPAFASRGAYRGGVASALRVATLALLAIGAAAWGLVRHYTHVPAPMRVPVSPTVPSGAPTYDPEAGELPVPELEGVDTAAAPAAPRGGR
jgi:hypothetical protein